MESNGKKPTNPFGVADVPDPDGPDVRTFATQVKLPGDAHDPNAPLWMALTVDVLDGEWASRWNGGTQEGWLVGMAQVKCVGQRVYILFRDQHWTYLIDTQRLGKDLLVGRYVNVGVPDDSSPWVGRIINAERIDGQWSHGRWDLRRQLGGGCP